jgi:hypothetical protein
MSQYIHSSDSIENLRLSLGEPPYFVHLPTPVLKNQTNLLEQAKESPKQTLNDCLICSAVSVSSVIFTM